MRFDRQQLWTVLGASLVLALSTTAGLSASQCETVKQQFNTCVHQNQATALAAGDTGYIRRCLNRFPYLNFCMSALPDGNGQNDPDGFVYAPAPSAGGGERVLDTSLRDRLRASLRDRLKGYDKSAGEEKPAGAGVLDLRSPPVEPTPEQSAEVLPPPPDPKRNCEASGNTWARERVGDPNSRFKCFVGWTNEDRQATEDLVNEGIKFLWDTGEVK